ncbi:hypothetical protein [Enterococcus sp. AZ103]|uniref:hypothetical protein n=1 Tax=Enterococcus sp. AZ103 TaxID=2774628 RepID=UPI003F299375
MKSLFEVINDRLLGEVGRTLVTFLLDNKMLFLILFAFYGCLLLYSKTIYMYYVPKKIKEFITKNKLLTTKQLHEGWKKERKTIPLFILVPTRNEMWVRPLKYSDGNYEMLFFNKKNSYTSESKMIDSIYENLKGDFPIG